LLSFTDQLNNSIHISFPPKRIVSLVPSQTELLYSLGLDEEVLGITKFCVHPNKWFTTKQRVGGTKTVKIDLIKNLQPDLIIANKEENVKEQIEALNSIAPVWVSDIHSLNDALIMIKSIGELVNKPIDANKIVSDIKVEFEQLRFSKTRYRTAYLIWKDPFMAAGSDTFINDVMSYCGFDNILKDHLRYPQITVEQIQAKECELLMLSSEPYPFKEKHVKELQQQLPRTRIILVDGEFFSWYGSRLLLASTYLKTLIKSLAE
jgi:ABC-type Fe3+-hydroxamate transport system substrate-binding protein